MFAGIGHPQNVATDTAGFKKEFEQLLKKYGLNSKGYLLNVTSVNQKGGQTAFIITNNYYRDTILNETNFEFKIDTEGGQKVLIVHPKTGIWSSPFVMTDSLKANRNFSDPGIGVVAWIQGLELFFEGKKYSLVGFGKNSPCSKRFPLYIYLNKDDPDEIFLFGDIQDPNKSYLYYKGAVTWMPEINTEIKK
jgi:hypothetical protein